MSWEKYRPDIHTKWKTYWYETHPPEIAAESWNYLFTGGKEIRSRLFCELWAYLSPDQNISAELAFAIECIHVASLILDDTPWMDNAMTRRGKPTLHLVFSNKKSLLLFHDVMFMVYRIWQENKPDHISLSDWEELIVSKLQRLMVGQWYDLEKKGTLIELASMKTGVLFELVAETVALCTGLDRHTWKMWGNHVGILFQWMDDWSDQEEDIAQQNRNAFNESYNDTLSYYGAIWGKIEKEIGPSWFTRPFGKFMKQYFTNDIPLLNTSSVSASLSELFIAYPIPILPTYSELEDTPVVSIERPTININYRKSVELNKADIEALLRSKQPIDITINGMNFMNVDCDELFHLELIKWANLFNQDNVVKITGKQMIRLMMRIIRIFKQAKEKYIEKYRLRYESLKQKIWSIVETEWEYQSEIIDFIYDEFQSVNDLS